MSLTFTPYYEELLRYHAMAKHQQEQCNLGLVAYADAFKPPFTDGTERDALMENVYLYDVVERRYAGFSQLIHDCFYGTTKEHPYWQKMQIAGCSSSSRRWISESWNDGAARQTFGLPEWLYVFLVHRLTGSGINYALSPSGYYNSVVPEFYECTSIEGMTKIIKNHGGSPIYTSVGYQFPAFPKLPAGSDFTRAGDYFLCKYAPTLARELAAYIGFGPPKDLRAVGEWMFAWNRARGLNAYRFQYAAVIADICDWFPMLVNRESPFYYGSNAVECISYLVEPFGKKKSEEVLDAVMQKAMADTGNVPYNLEDVCCDFIRWVENYVKPGGAYDYLDRDRLWSSCKIKDHPFGRQKIMLELGLIKSFNDLAGHPADDYVISRAGLTAEQYRAAARVTYVQRISLGPSSDSKIQWA